MVCDRRVGEAVHALSKQRFEKRFGRSVCPRRSTGGCSGAGCRARSRFWPRDRSVGLRVVGEHSFDREPKLGVPAGSTLKEGGAVFFALCREELGVGEPAVIVDRDVRVLPAGARAALHAVLKDPLADLVETTELLRFRVQELAGPGALVAHPRIGARSRETGAAGTTEGLADRRGGTTAGSRDHDSAGTQMLAPAEDLGLLVCTKTQRLPSWRRGTIRKRLPAALPVASPEAVAGRAAAPHTAAAAGGLSPATINATIRQRDSNEKLIRLGGQTELGIRASFTSRDLDKPKTCGRLRRNQPSRRCVVSPPRRAPRRSDPPSG